MALDASLLAALQKAGLVNESDLALLQEALAGVEPITDEDVEVALSAWDKTFPDLAGLLDAEVSDGPVEL